MSVVVRFAPSPTGYLHIGNARTAIFNWFYARHTGGKFLLRIEDTDRERSTEPAIKAIFDGLKWLGLDWDGEATFQFARAPRHAAVAQELVERGQAYYCYCTPDELEAMKADAAAKGEQPRYDRRWRDRDPKDAPAGIKPVIRIKAPLSGESVVEDMVQGRVVVPAAQLDDFILLRSDGTPTYMLAVVVDDHDMGVTHVIRGDDHLNNAHRQQLIIKAMEWDIPTYAHMPLIHGEDGAKLSKRHGALSVTEYADMGYLPDAMVNYLMRLGWGHGDDEIFTRAQAIDWFDVKDISKAPSRLDFKKLAHVNAHYLKLADNAELANEVIRRAGVAATDTQRGWLIAGMDDLKDRATTLVELTDSAHFYLGDHVIRDDKAAKALSDNPGAIPSLRALFEEMDAFDTGSIEAAIKQLANDKFDGKLGKLGMPLRAALTGTTTSPNVFKVASILGRDECLKRMQNM